jgi:hypothetical protein
LGVLLMKLLETAFSSGLLAVSLIVPPDAKSILP